MALLVAVAALTPACSPARERPPNIDRLAHRSTLYEEVRAPTPWTLPSHAAMLSGMHPLRLGILSENGVIPKRAPLVAEALSRAGYQTAAFVDSGPGGFVGARRGFGRGFATFKHGPFEPHGPYKYALRRGDLKLVHHRLGGGPYVDEFYDLARDPSERRAGPADGDVARAMLAEIETGRRDAGAEELLQPGGETIEELRALGYT